MKKQNILKDECLNAVMRNEVLRQQISEVLGGIQLGSVRMLARTALKSQERNKLYDSESLEVIKDFLGFKSVKEMYKPN